MNNHAAALEQLRLARQQIVQELCREMEANPDRLLPDLGIMHMIATIQGTIAALEAEERREQLGRAA
jgi:hypothetical protein